MKVVNTPQGEVRLLPPPAELLRAIRAFMPFGAVRHVPSEQGADFGLVIPCGGQELFAVAAMGCHKTITAQIDSRGGDYLLALKGDHPALRADVERLFSDKAPRARQKPTRTKTVEKDPGRIETRRTVALDATALLGGQRG